MTMILLVDPLLIFLGALLVAVSAGALLAPSGRSAEPQFFRSQWLGRPTPRATYFGDPCPH